MWTKWRCSLVLYQVISHVDNVLNEETVGNLQQIEIALCSEVKADVKNLQSEMESRKK